MRNLSIQMGELQESVGAAVAPIIEKLLPAFQGIAGWISENTGLVVGLGLTIGGVALAISGMNAALVAWNAVTKITAALNAVLGTSFSALWVATGVGIIIAIIAAVVALQAKFKFMDNVIAGVKAGFQAFWNFVSSVFGWIYDKIQIVASFFGTIFQLYIDSVVGYFKVWYTVVETIVGAIVDVFKGAADLISGIIKGITDGFITAFKAAINTVIDIINKAIKLYNKIPLAPNLPTIPKLADGGIVTGPTVAMIGEAGPEAVIPLDRLGGMGGITINIAGSVTSENDLVETIRRGLVRAQRNGSQLVYTNT
jgi:hypothetical protein